MNWEALKDDECPKCGEPLQEIEDLGVWDCSSFDCDFTIKSAKKEEIAERDDEHFENYQW